MFKDVENVLDLENLNGLAGTSPFIFIKNYKVDGSFLLHHLISHGLRHDYAIFFVHSYQTLSHYKSVQVKLGNSQAFNKQVEQGRFVNFDLLKLFESRQNNQQDLSVEILDFFKQKVASKMADSKLLVIFDDLSILSLIDFVSNSQLIRLVNGFQELLSIQSGNQQCQNLLVLNTQEFDDHDPAELSPSFLMQLAHLADIYVDVNHLTTGYLKEINGQVSHS